MSLDPRPTVFANNPLDRAGHLRTNPGMDSSAITGLKNAYHADMAG